MLSKPTGAKAARRMLMTLTPKSNFTNQLGNYSYTRVKLDKFWTKFENYQFDSKSGQLSSLLNVFLFIIKVF